MNDLNQSKSDLGALKCVGCGYELRGLPLDGICPECGTTIKISSQRAAEIDLPRKLIPRLRTASILLVPATLTGAPAIVAYAIVPLFGVHWIVDPRHNLPWILNPILPLLFLGGALFPMCTVGIMPSTIRSKSRLITSLIFSLVAIIAVFLMMQGTASRSGNLLRGDLLFTLGSTMAVVACIINLTVATRIIGSVVPGWRRLHGARQTRGPLLAAVALICLGRWSLPETSVGLTALQDLIVTWGNIILLGSEALLAIGGIYLLFNRLWLVARLRGAMTAARKLEA